MTHKSYANSLFSKHYKMFKDKFGDFVSDKKYREAGKEHALREVKEMIEGFQKVKQELENL